MRTKRSDIGGLNVAHLDIRRQRECVVGKDIRAANQFLVVIDKVRIADSSQQFDGENFLDGLFESHEADNLPGIEIDNPDAADAFL
jgi:hypothetical protein